MYLQCWYADNSACAGKLSHIHSWLNRLIQLGPAYEPTKSFLVVAKQYEEAKEHFDHGVIVVSGHRFLSGIRTVKSHISMGRWMAG